MLSESMSQIGPTCLLQSAATDRVLAEALNTRAGVKLYVDGDGVQVDASGEIAGGDDAHLVIRLTHPDPVLRTCPPDRPLRVTMTVADAQYEFETRCVEQPTTSDARVIRILRPRTITSADRRRSLRRFLRGTTNVGLRAPDANEEWHCNAVMLNLSPDGIACRMSEQHAGPLHIDQTVRVTFHLGRPSRLFDLTGRVSNITRGATPGQLVVGLEFAVDRRSEESRAGLRRVLETRCQTHR